MLEKQVYDLELRDFIQHPIWYFPMDDSVEDELSVKPFDINELPGDYQVIIKCFFSDCEGKQYIGYIYWNSPPKIEDIKPVLFTSGEGCITFWNGIAKPSWTDYDATLQAIRNYFPITFSSEAIENFPSISGTLEGLYFFGDDNSIQYII
jgi:hypothetical protein